MLKFLKKVSINTNTNQYQSIFRDTYLISQKKLGSSWIENSFARPQSITSHHFRSSQYNVIKHHIVEVPIRYQAITAGTFCSRRKIYGGKSSCFCHVSENNRYFGREGVYLVVDDKMHICLINNGC